VHTLGNHLGVVTGEDLGAGVDTLGERQGDGHVSSGDEHLGAVVETEGGVAATLLLAEGIKRAQELLVRLDAAGLGEDHTTLEVLTLDTTEKDTGVVASLGLVKLLLEHLNTGHNSLLGLGAETNDLDLLTLLEGTALDTASGDSTTARDGERGLNGHEEALLKVTARGRDPLINALEKLQNAVLADLGGLVLQGGKSGAHDHGRVLAVETVGAKKLAHLHLDQLKHLRVVHGVNLVHKNNNVLDTDLTGQEQVLTSLGHLTIAGSNNNDGAVHAGSTADHVLDIVGMAGAVDVGVVAVRGLVLDVGRRDGDTTGTLLGRLVDGSIVEERGTAVLSQSLGDRSSKGSLTVIDVANRADVQVGLRTLESGSRAKTAKLRSNGLDSTRGAQTQVGQHRRAAESNHGVGKEKEDRVGGEIWQLGFRGKGRSRFFTNHKC